MRSATNVLKLLGVSAVAMVVCGASEPDQSTVARGAYLARITGCIGCHTPRTPSGSVQEDKLFSGGDHPIPANGGRVRIFPPNITPDNETGVGAWQVPEIARAIKTGQARDGRLLSAAMPWRSQFQAMDDADATAIATFVKSTSAIRHAVPAPILADSKGPEPHASGPPHADVK